ncbi:putative Thiamine biosynthesis protein [Megalodesulfovibrio gigas DSM 1382 = ATCC 19364]|uniref:Putative Thiamine biosynthesis protein n=1 Tax=Megalodesulfovibrio gigas (strain ATCC 19364 / DSM 1382 / NCIMB 9332 / VKM B-1759) TaxID=1121448 RepID=T2GES7_MEGG1|nr:putative Thiamine biosynthesis protein [Megalodesulfovibrio gigas]AGW14437.1 putative Thiamine biosynthesis protein [Megalodesulfovibrio gigas DSM 1382 = ATCC 19364]
MSPSSFHALALFSGGLDSVLAARLVLAQGRRVTGLHFVSPFFGKPQLLPAWQEMYGLDLVPVDVSDAYVRLLLDGPAHGYGKNLNPCVDCKILMLARARQLLAEYGAQCIVSGEVLGQRPMSQRRDALDIISREAGVRDLLVRPLCAQKLAPTPVEEAGILDRARLRDFWGRGRSGQLTLARELGITSIPTPAGGCLLAEKESVRRYWPVLRRVPAPSPVDFHIANAGRQFWNGQHWLAIGRNREANERLEALAGPQDLVFTLRDMPGPLGLGRQWPGLRWTAETVRTAAAAVLSFSSKVKELRKEAAVVVCGAGHQETVIAMPQPPESIGWLDPSFAVFLEEKRALCKTAGQVLDDFG